MRPVARDVWLPPAHHTRDSYTPVALLIGRDGNMASPPFLTIAVFECIDLANDLVSSSKALSKKKTETKIVTGHGLRLNLASFLDDGQYLGCIVQTDICQI